MMHEWSTMKRLIYLRGNPATGGGGGSPMTVTGATPLLMPGAVAKPMRAATFQISPVQSGSGDPSPQNVRAITGWTAANVTLTGRNIANVPDLLTPSGYNQKIIQNIDYLAGKTVTISGYLFAVVSGGTSESGVRFRLIYTQNGTTKSGVGIGGKPVGLNKWEYGHTTFTIPSDATNISIHTYRSGAAVTATGYKDVQLEYGDEASPYTPYSGSSLSVEFPESVGTVYGGTVDPVTGQGVIDGIRFVFDGDTDKWAAPATWYSYDAGQGYDTFGAYWYFNQTYKGFSDLPLSKAYPTTSEKMGQLFSDKLKLQPYGLYARDESFIWDINTGSSQYISVRLPKSVLSDYSSSSALAQSVMEYFQQNPTEFFYHIATPIPFTIPPQPLTPPAGDAYIWADCGSSAEVTYIGKA